jgi:tetratricopeptide (TPR) repeat protein
MTIPAILFAALLAAPQADPPATTSLASGGSADISLDAGIAAYRRRRFAQAETEFQKAVDANPQSAAAQYYLGYSIYKRFEFRRNHPDKQRAADHFAKAFQLDPGFRPDWGRPRR